MGTFLGLVGKLGYRGCYRVLDAQYCRVDGFSGAVPQRRRRVFFVGHLGDDCRAFPVLFEPESLRGHPAPRREAGQGTATDVAPSLVSSGRGVERTGETRGQDPVAAIQCAAIAPTLNAAFGDKLGLEDQHINGGGACSLPPVSMCLNAGAMGRQDAESETLIAITGGAFDVAHTLKADGFDASEDGTGRGTPIVPMAFPERMSGTQYASTENLCPALCAVNPTGIAFSSKDHGADAAEGLAPTLRSMGHDGSHANGGGQLAVAIQAGATRENPASGPDGVGVQEGIAYTLEARAEVQACAFDMRGREGGAQFEGPHDTANIRAASGGSSKSYVAESWAVRRLTPTECERLQGFPDGWTQVPHRGKPAADGPRYRAIGNSMAVNCMRWIGQRIQWADSAAEAAEKGVEA